MWTVSLAPRVTSTYASKILMPRWVETTWDWMIFILVCEARRRLLGLLQGQVPDPSLLSLPRPFPNPPLFRFSWSGWRAWGPCGGVLPKVRLSVEKNCHENLSGSALSSLGGGGGQRHLVRPLQRQQLRCQHATIHLRRGFYDRNPGPLFHGLAPDRPQHLEHLHR